VSGGVSEAGLPFNGRKKAVLARRKKKKGGRGNRPMG